MAAGLGGQEGKVLLEVRMAVMHVGHPLDSARGVNAKQGEEEVLPRWPAEYVHPHQGARQLERPVPQQEGG